MTFGILQTGAPPHPLNERFGSYAEMTRRLLGPGVETHVYDVRAGELPKDGSERAGWLITGSSSGVYDPQPWIEPLKGFLREAAGKAPLVGICFGHQVMAEAFGGRVIKSPRGWGVGLHRYAVMRREPWMDGGEAISLPVSHQDQVVELGPGAEVLGGSDFTPFGLLAYPERRAISIQAHPEFEPAFAAALVSALRERLGAATADAAMAELALPNDRERVAAWIRGFLGVGRPAA